MARKATPDYNLAVLHPDVAKEWHPTKNGEFTPRDYTHGSGQKVWWKCKKGHEWDATIAHRTNGRGCPECGGQKVGRGQWENQT